MDTVMQFTIRYVPQKEHVHLWTIGLKSGDSVHAALPKLLSREELDTAARLKQPEQQKLWIAAHGALRSILSMYARCEPQSLSFRRGQYGKPELCSPSSHIRFNLTHTGNHAMIAVAGVNVGIDAELITSTVPVEDLARRFLSANESAQIFALPPDEQRIAFFNCWTRKEAMGKALGSGWSEQLNRFDVPFLTSQPVRMAVEHESKVVELTLIELGGNGIAAALAADIWPVLLDRFTLDLANIIGK
jgi:4'-phosphopantetheinyl transferase